MNIWIDESGQLFGEDMKDFVIGAEVKFNEEVVGTITDVSPTNVAFVQIYPPHKVPVSEWNTIDENMEIVEVSLVEHMTLVSGGVLAMVINVEEPSIRKNRFAIARERE